MRQRLDAYELAVEDGAYEYKDFPVEDYDEFWYHESEAIEWSGGMDRIYEAQPTYG